MQAHDAAPGVIRVDNDLDRRAGRHVFKLRIDALATVARHNDDALYPLPVKVFHMAPQQGFASKLQQAFGPLPGKLPQAPPKAGGKQDGFHWPRRRLSARYLFINDAVEASWEEPTACPAANSPAICPASSFPSSTPH